MHNLLNREFSRVYDTIKIFSNARGMHSLWRCLLVYANVAPDNISSYIIIAWFSVMKSSPMYQRSGLGDDQYALCNLELALIV